MFVPFLIMLREGLEAALIITLVASYLKKTKQEKWFKSMWEGIFFAVLFCIILGTVINEVIGEFPQKQQELFEGIVSIITIFILTHMVFWMKKNSFKMKLNLEKNVSQALKKNNSFLLLFTVFLAVTREGMESVFFLITAFQQDVGIAPPIGAILGLIFSIGIGSFLYWSSKKINLILFFKWSSLFILFFSAGLASNAIRSFHEAGLWNYFQNIVFDLSNFISENTLYGTLLQTFFGYHEFATLSEIFIYLIYLIPTLLFFFLSNRSSNFSIKKL